MSALPCFHYVLCSVRGLKCNLQSLIVLQRKPKLLPVFWLIRFYSAFARCIVSTVFRFNTTLLMLLMYLFYWQKLQTWMGFVCSLWFRCLQNGEDNNHQTINILHSSRWIFSASERQMADTDTPFWSGIL